MRPVLRTSMTLVVILLVFLAFNLVWINRLPNAQWDISHLKVHTLSAAVQRSLTTLESPIELYYFNSHTDPNTHRVLRRYSQQVEDLLREYEKAAQGLINLHVINPAPFSEESYKAELFGLDVKQGVFGLIGTRAGQGPQRIASFDRDRAPLLEYEISHLLHKLTKPERATVGLLSGLPIKTATEQRLTQQFNLVTVTPNVERLPQTVQTLMVMHPHKLPDPALYAIDQFVLEGGKLLMFIGPKEGKASSPSRLDGMLASWGLEVSTDKLLADSFYATPITLTAGMPTVRHPARLTLPRQAMNAHDISSWKLASVVVSKSAALTPLKNGRTRFTPLLQSSAHAALMDAKRFASPDTFNTLIEEASAEGQHHVIAARIEGPGYSAFPDGIEGQPPGLQKASQIQVVVVAVPDMLANTTPDNGLFVLNVLDNLAAPEPLASIRPRAMGGLPLQVLADLREAAARSYRQNAVELEQRLERTEQEWQLLNPPAQMVGAQAVETNMLLQALNKERLRLPMELHMLKSQAYASVDRLELIIKSLLIVPIPLLLCLIAMGLSLRRRRHWPLPAAVSQ
ncbi:Gldg family protein [Pseudomonas sp. SDO5271_S396]